MRDSRGRFVKLGGGSSGGGTSGIQDKINPAWTRLLQFAKTAQTGIAAAIGVQGDRAVATSEEHSGKSNVAIAAIHEFGAKNNRPPERSFLRSTFDEKNKTYQGELDNIAKGIFDGGGTVDGHLLLLGEKMRRDIVEKINAGIEPALKPETIAAKDGETTPLVRSGQLRNAFSVEVTHNPREKEN